MKKRIPFSNLEYIKRFVSAFKNDHPVQDLNQFYWVLDFKYDGQTDEIEFELDRFSFH